jgi:hypothetical protein
MSESSKLAACRAIALLAAAGAASAVAIGGVVDADPTKSNGTFISGSGIPGDNFASDSGGGVSVFLKPRGRAPAPNSG